MSASQRPVDPSLETRYRIAQMPERVP